ncbi:hypothetical protein ACFSHP_26155 [Novosphingobium panipatense]
MFHEQQRNDEMPGGKSEGMRAAEVIVEPRLGVAGLDLAQPARADSDTSGEVFLRNLFGTPLHFYPSPRHQLDRRKHRGIACSGHRLKRHDKISLPMAQSSRAQPSSEKMLFVTPNVNPVMLSW